MAYFDTEKETFITVDASPIGVSAILLQSEKGYPDRKIIACAGRVLFPIERRYGQTEKEALSNIYRVEHFHLYFHGASFILITDDIRHWKLSLVIHEAKHQLALNVRYYVFSSINLRSFIDQ